MEPTQPQNDQTPAPQAPQPTEADPPYTRRSFYVEDALWFPFQSKLWANRTNASRWIREQIEAYIKS